MAAELRADIDHFHDPPREAAGDPSWAEWHYFNLISPDRRRWAFISFTIAGAAGGDANKWGGQVLVTVHEQGKPARRFINTVPSSAVRYSITDADVRIGASSVTVQRDGDYRVRVVAREEGTGVPLALDLVVSPAPGAYFPGATLASGVQSGYVVPALRADASGTSCIAGACMRHVGVQAYHDHNWGVWRGVTWEWGAARAGAFTLLYGRVQPPDHVGSTQPLFVYVVDSLGFLAVFRPKDIRYSDARSTIVNGRTMRTPAAAEIVDVRDGDTLHLVLRIEDASATDTRASLVERGEALAARGLARPYFVQMKGTATIAGRIRGTPLVGSGAGFFETYR
jgi:hypothetical protein